MSNPGARPVRSGSRVTFLAGSQQVSRIYGRSLDLRSSKCYALHGNRCRLRCYARQSAISPYKPRYRRHARRGYTGYRHPGLNRISTSDLCSRGIRRTDRAILPGRERCAGPGCCGRRDNRCKPGHPGYFPGSMRRHGCWFYTVWKICSWHCPQVVEISERGCAGGFTLWAP